MSVNELLMRIKCPYCNCHYDIHPDTLGNPVGNINLGFGWWLRCYQCQRKFWLKSTTVINTGFSPVKADRNRTIKKLSKLTNKKGKRNHSSRNVLIYIIILVLTVTIGICYTHMEHIQSFFANKVRHFTNSTVTTVTLSNITYRIDQLNNQYKLTVMGDVINTTPSIKSYNGIHIVLLSFGKEIASWTFVPEMKSVIPGGRVAINTSSILNAVPKDIQVLVRIV